MQKGSQGAKALFAERFADRVKVEEGIKTINVWELVKVVGINKEKFEVAAKVDTGAWRTSIDKKLATKLGLTKRSNLLWSKKVKSGLGKEVRQVINLKYYIAGRKIKTIASLANRSHLRSQLIIGRRDLEGFLVKSSEKDVESKDWYRKLWTKYQKKL
jgi:hypothetical protein